MIKYIILLSLFANILFSSTGLEPFSGTSIYQYHFDTINKPEKVREIIVTLKRLIQLNPELNTGVTIEENLINNALFLNIKNEKQVKILEQYLLQLDRLPESKTTKIVQLQYTNSKDIAQQLHKLFGLVSEERQKHNYLLKTTQFSGPIQIVASPATNSIILSGSYKNVKKAQKIILNLDTRTTQVLIEVLISEVTLNDDASLGIEWKQFGNGVGGKNVANATVIDYGHLNGSTIANNLKSNLTGLKFSILNQNQFELFLNNIEQKNKIQVISRPKILTSNNNMAQFKATQRNPILKTTNADGIVNNAVEYTDIGVDLRVTPRINKDGYISLNIEQVIQEIIGTDVQVLNSPIYSERLIKTALLVKNNHTIVMGGIISSSERETISRVPILSKVPLLKKLFKSRSRNHQKTEMMIFITPHLIHDSTVADEFTELEVDTITSSDEVRKFTKRNKLFNQALAKHIPEIGRIIQVNLESDMVLINTNLENLLTVGKTYSIVRTKNSYIKEDTQQLIGVDSDFISDVTIVRQVDGTLYKASIQEGGERIKVGDIINNQSNAQFIDCKLKNSTSKIKAEVAITQNNKVINAQLQLDFDIKNEDNTNIKTFTVSDGVLTKDSRFFSDGVEVPAKIIDTKEDDVQGKKLTRYTFQLTLNKPILPNQTQSFIYKTTFPKPLLSKMRAESTFSITSTNRFNAVYDFIYDQSIQDIEANPKPVSILHKDGKRIYRYFKPKQQRMLKIQHHYPAFLKKVKKDKSLIQKLLSN
ncbi:MAG: type II secretion system protein GspD [Candidatus Cloacimonetes bacterium]|nr:type II secretion system protein GspD [Candidatus Cloacimonadota bacterium]